MLFSANEIVKRVQLSMAYGFAKWIDVVLRLKFLKFYTFAGPSCCNGSEREHLACMGQSSSLLGSIHKNPVQRWHLSGSHGPLF